jgi:hypothetical protein
MAVGVAVASSSNESVTPGTTISTK